jgi:hypothetical protein
VRVPHAVMKAPALAASLAVFAAAGFGAAHALADSGPQQVTLPTSLPGTVTVTLPVTTATLPLPTTSAPLPTTSAPLPTTSAPLPTTSTPLPTTSTPVPTTSAPVPTTGQPPASASPSTPPTAPASSAPGSSASAQSSSSPSAPAAAGATGSSPGTAPAPVRGSSGGLTVASTSRGRAGRRAKFLGFRLSRPARVVAVFRGPAPSCEIAYTFRGRGRSGANRVPASALVRKGLVEAGVYAVRVVAVRGEQRRRIGDIVVDVRRREVRRLSGDRHRCRAAAPRGVLAAAGPAFGIGPAPPPAEGARAPLRRSGVASEREVELPPSPGLPSVIGDLPSLAAPVLYGAIGLVLIALAAIAVRVARAFR